MTKKKLKLKSVKDIKNSIKEEKGKKRKKRNKKIPIGRILLMFFITIGIVVASVGIAFCLYIVFTAPEFTQEVLYNRQVSVIRWSNGEKMAEYGTENRVNKNYEDFPQVLVDALVATEDARFFQHAGFDAARFLKASIGQALGSAGAGGASTLSMQLSKNYFNGTEDSGIEGIIRKFKDIYMSVFKIEKNYTKEQIIEMYLNSWQFAGGGTNYKGIFGIEQASQHFFKKSVSDLSLPECAILVGMINAPTLYNPYFYPEYSNDRKNTVLSLMYRHGYISETEMKDAQSIHVSSLVVAQNSSQSSNPYQVLIDHVVREIKENEGIDLYNDPGSYDITTTFDKNIQDTLQHVLTGNVYKFKDEKVQTSSVVTSISDGSIKGMTPGRGYEPLGVNRATSYQIDKRQPGSTAKPLVDYGPLIEYNNASTGQMFIDFKYQYNQGITLNNWDLRHLGVMTMKNALSSSRNTTALQAFHQVNPDNIKEFLANLGIKEDNYGNNGILESMCIGGFQYGLDPLESSAAYAAFARDGYYIEPYSYYKIVNNETEEVIEHKVERKRAMSEETAYMITDILLQATQENVAGNVNYNLRGTIASKSGTSDIDAQLAKDKGINGYATPDHWVNTYNKDYSISTWLGYDSKDLDKDHYFMSNEGSAARALISAYLANNIQTSNKKFERPSNVTSVTIEKNILPSKRASEYTPDNMKQTALFKAGTEPSETSNRFAKLDNSKNGKSSVKEKTISLSWDEVTTPDALDLKKVRADFANSFKDYKKRYNHSYTQFENEYMKLYEQYTTSSIGSFGYQVYLKDKNGNTKDLGWTQNNNYSYTVPTGGEYEFIIKSSYSIFKSNQSTGLSIKVKVDSEEDEKIVATPVILCIEKDGIINPKNGVKVTLNKEDVTSLATIIASSVDTSTIGEKDITYTVTYKGQTVKVNGKINVSESCNVDNVN